MPITSPQPGLVAVYHLDGNAADAIAGHNGTTSGTAAYLAPPVALTCGSTTSSQLCLSGNRFAVKSGQTKRYFNYQGINAPAVNDTDAFATCP